MSRRLRRGGAVLLVLALVPGLSACGEDGFDPATNLVTADNAAGATKTEAIIARAIVVVKSKGANVSALAGTLINRSKVADVLQTVEIRTSPSAAPLTLSPALAINPGQVIAMGTAAQEPLTVNDGGTLLVGHFVDVTLRFKTAGDVRLEVPVALRDHFYSDVEPATGTTSTQAERKLSDTAKKTAAASGSTVSTDNAATDKAVTDKAVTDKAATGKTTTAPAATKSDATRSTAKRAATKPAAEHSAGHDPAAPTH